MKTKNVNAWAVVMFDGFLPDFNIEGKMNNVYQIHSKKSSAEKLAREVNKNSDDYTSKGEKLWSAVPCTITYNYEN